MDLFRSMQIFVEVARKKSFRGAAENLEIPNSTVSRRIAELEKDVGLRLFERSTRSVSLTDAGKLYFDNCERIIEYARLAREQLTDLRTSPSGLLRLVANVVPANEWIIPLLPAFSLRFPDITIELDIVSDVPSPLEKDVDIAFVMGPITQEDLVARRIIRLEELALYATPAYLKDCGEPNTPADLSNHEALRHLRARFSVANFMCLQKLCLEDMGIAVWHNWVVNDFVEKRQLQRVLPEWSLEPWEFYAVTTSRHVPAKARALLDFLIEKRLR
jgi:DNA-binding transcriptional LysR family regulator